MEANIQDAKLQIAEKPGDLPLKQCFETALRFEQPTIMKIYVPIIRSLRKNWTNTALDFYIMVKAHLARITRVMESFSGDPLAIQRSNLLQQSFEKEVQTPQEVIKPAEKANKKRVIQPIRESGGKSKSPSRKQVSAKPLSKIVSVPAKHAKIHHSRTKPLVKNLGLQSRRAHR
jgi:hypothetical protein